MGRAVGEVSVVLSGGGAAAIGQVPVLEALDEMDVRVGAVAGSSMGAVIGALRAAGYAGDSIRARVLEVAGKLPDTGLEILRGLSLKEPGGGLLPDPEQIVTEILPDDMPETFEDLTIPLAAIATDFYGQCLHLFDSGPLRPALAASLAIPGVLRPVRIDGRIFVDGGVANNLPITAVPDGCPVVAVDVVTDPPEDTGTVPGPLACSLGAMRIMMRTMIEERLDAAEPDVLIRPASAEFGPLDFHRVQEILDAAEPARDETRRAVTELFE